VVDGSEVLNCMRELNRTLGGCCSTNLFSPFPELGSNLKGEDA